MTAERFYAKHGQQAWRELTETDWIELEALCGFQSPEGKALTNGFSVVRLGERVLARRIAVKDLHLYDWEGGRVDLPTRVTVVEVPGHFYATYDENHDRITDLAFCPSGSDPGHLACGGVTAFIEEGDDDLDVNDVDGPFWTAMQAGLPHLEIAWRE